MSEMLVAQCPHCRTRFRLSQEHLQAAAGNVRCGACLKVFDASTQIQIEPPASTPEPLQPPAPRSESPMTRQGALLIHDDLELDDLDLEALGLDESLLDEINPDARTGLPTPASPAADSMPEDDKAPAPAEHQDPLPAQPDDIDSASTAYPVTDEPIFNSDTHDSLTLESDDPEPFNDDPAAEDPVAVQPVAEQTAAEPQAEQAAPRQTTWIPTDDEIDRAFEFDEAPQSADAWDQEFNLDNDLESEKRRLRQDPDALDDMELHDAFKAAARSRDFEPRIDPVEESSPEPQAQDQPQLFGIEQHAPIRPLTAARDHGIFLRDHPALAYPGDPSAFRPPRFDDATYREPEELPARPQDKRREPDLRSSFGLPEVIDEPLYLDDRPLARRPRRQWLWASLSVLAALALLAQALTYNYTALAHDERIRPVMEQVCFLAGCQLPARVDIDLIRSSNLVVRPHADFPNALAIDVILYNRADFAQPFPVLRMTFTDLSGRELSSKLFRPAEYLGGELAGATLMPPQTPVHVGLDMLDPGQQAASYNLDFLSP
jgi:predicted Zn finger-like uncharacterized protein